MPSSVAYRSRAPPRTPAGTSSPHSASAADVRAPEEASSKRYAPPSPMRTIRSPERSVRSTRHPVCESSRRVDSRGWPNRLPSPTLIRATSGLSAAIVSAETAPTLPWWPTLSTSTSPSTPDVTSGSSTSASASPVSSAVKPRHCTRTTTLDALSAASDTGETGDTTSSCMLPTVTTDPAATSTTLPPDAERACSTADEGFASAPMAT